MDQTFSPRSLRNAWDLESRKGVNLARKFERPGAPADIDLAAIRRNYSSSAAARATLKKLRTSGALSTRVKRAEARVKTLREGRTAIVDRFLERMHKEIDAPGFSIAFSKRYSERGDDVFDLGDPYPASYLAAKVVGRNVRAALGIKPSSRDEIVAQMAVLLDDDYPKTVVRADIKQFYESIDHEILLSGLRRSTSLSTASIRTIRRVLDTYRGLTGRKAGLPRGLGLSADLAEAHMTSFDEHFRHHPSTIFYARFVDDIVIVAREPGADKYLAQVEAQLSLIGLQITDNPRKLFEEQYKRGTPLPSFSFLGYEFKFQKQLLIGLSAARRAKLSRRLNASFAAYHASPTRGKRASILLVKRVQFLTSNTRLLNNKRAAFVGIGFSNRHINSDLDLVDLDTQLNRHVASISDPGLASRLKKTSFVAGWRALTFRKYSIAELVEIASVWKNVA